ncbi:unnamed protein product, partial [Rotaria sordida]
MSLTQPSQTPPTPRIHEFPAEIHRKDIVSDISIEVPPKSKSGGQQLTPDEDNEYRQMQDLLWSDPDPHNRQGCRNNDDRNIGCFFGPDITEQFLNEYNYSMLIRSHQVKERGYEFTHDHKVLTVFSASNYCGGSNWGAVIR